jgi:WD40 repeat protein
VALAWTAGGLSVGASPAAFRRLDVQGHVVGVSYSPSAPLLASITRAGLIQVFDTRTDRELARQFAHPGGATDIAFSLDGALLASSGPTGSIVLMDASVFAAARPGLEARTADRYGLPRPTEQLESP